MNSQEMGIDFGHRKKTLKKEKEKEKEKEKKKYKGWVKTTKLIQQKVESAFLGFFGQKKAKTPVIVTGKCRPGGLEGLKNKKSSMESSGKTQTTLSNLFQQIPETNEQENLRIVSSWGVSAKPKLKIARSMRKRGNVRVGEESKESEALDQKNSEKRDEEEEEEMELCKKRILMGGKCKPLEFSGVLHSRKNGMFSSGR